MHPRGVGACASRAVQCNARHFPPLPRARALRTMVDCEDADIEYHEDDPAEAAAASLSDDLRPPQHDGRAPLGAASGVARSHVGSSSPRRRRPRPRPAAATTEVSILEHTFYVGGNVAWNVAAFLRGIPPDSTPSSLADENSPPDALALRPALHAAALAPSDNDASSVGDAPSAPMRTSPRGRRRQLPPS